MLHILIIYVTFGQDYQISFAGSGESSQVETVKVENLRVLKVVAEKNLLVVKGCVPGHKNSYVIIRK